MKVNVVIHIANCICLACSHLTAIHLRRPDLGINLVNILLSLGKETKKPHGDLFSKLATSTCLCSFRNQWAYLLETGSCKCRQLLDICDTYLSSEFNVVGFQVLLDQRLRPSFIRQLSDIL